MTLHVLTGGLMELFFDIAEICMEGLVAPGELRCLTHLIDIIAAALYTEEFSAADLQRLEKMIQTYMVEFVNLYEDVVERVKGGGMSAFFF